MRWLNYLNKHLKTLGKSFYNDKLIIKRFNHFESQ